MSGGINFGSLTIFINGKAVNLTDYDKDKDGKFQRDELIQIFEETELDTFNLKSLNQSKSEEETNANDFVLWGIRITMEEELRQLVDNVLSKEFIGKLAPYQSIVKDELRAFLTEYINSNNVETLADNFVELLSKKYEEIKEKYLGELSSATSDNNNKLIAMAEDVITEIIETLTIAPASYKIPLTRPLTDDQTLILKHALLTEAHKFIKTYTGGEATFKIALNVHLQEFLKESEQEVMQDITDDWKLLNENLGGYISQNEFNKLKRTAKKFLECAINNGINIIYGGTNIGIDNIDKLLKLFNKDGAPTNDAYALIALINKIIEKLSDKSRLDSILGGNVGAIVITGTWDINMEKVNDEPKDSSANKISQATLDMIDKVIDLLYAGYIKKFTTHKSIHKNKLGSMLEKEALSYMSSHPKASDMELTTHLSEFMEQNVYNSLRKHIEKWNAVNK